MKNLQIAFGVLCLFVLLGFLLFFNSAKITAFLSKNLYLVDQSVQYPEIDNIELKEGVAFRQAFRLNFDSLYKIYLRIRLMRPPDQGNLLLEITDTVDNVLYAKNISAADLAKATDGRLVLWLNGKVRGPRELFLRGTSSLVGGKVVLPVGYYRDARLPPQPFIKGYELFVFEKGEWAQKKGALTFASFAKADLGPKKVFKEIKNRFLEETNFMIFYGTLVMVIILRIIFLRRWA